MAGFGDLVQKAFYLGVGLASYAGEKAGSTVVELRGQVQKLADELVARGEMTTEEARKMVEDLMQQAQQPKAAAPEPDTPKEPRRIEIMDDDEEEGAIDNPEEIAALRQQVDFLQEQLRNLKQD
ncbi:phasin family protein [Trichothermofontia sp.]